MGAPGRPRARALPRVKTCDALFFWKGLGPPQGRALLLPLRVVVDPRITRLTSNCPPLRWSGLAGRGGGERRQRRPRPPLADAMASACDADHTTFDTYSGVIDCDGLFLGPASIFVSTQGTCRSYIHALQEVRFVASTRVRHDYFNSITTASADGTNTTFFPPFQGDLRVVDLCPVACSAEDVGPCAPCAATNTCIEPPEFVMGTRGATSCEEEGLQPLGSVFDCLNAHSQLGASRHPLVCRRTDANSERHPSPARRFARRVLRQTGKPSISQWMLPLALDQHLRIISSLQRECQPTHATLTPASPCSPS